MFSKHRHKSYVLKAGLVIAALIMVAVAGLSIMAIKAPMAPHKAVATASSPSPSPTATVPSDAGQLLSATPLGETTVEQTHSQSHYAYGGYTPAAKYGVRKTLITYRSYDLDGTPLTLYARVYQPIGVSAQPIFGFATGTTGIGDQCAPSLENVAVASWAGYDSHLTTYAGQGYAAVSTDYEGMRDPDRIHHYMVGALEGRAVLDSVKALVQLDAGTDQLDPGKLFLGGYSQGGHAALWADQIAASYAPGLKIAGVVGFGAVVDVTQTLADVTNGANINWFGPYVLTSYKDYYKDNYDLSALLLPKWTKSLKADVLSHCIDTDIEFWGSDPAKVYPPAMLEALKSGKLATIDAQLAKRLAANRAGTDPTHTPKLLNGGTKDNVVLPSQEAAAQKTLCSADNAKRGPVHLKEYPGATHYNTMAISFRDTLGWMAAISAGQPVPDDCSKPTI